MTCLSVLHPVSYSMGGLLAGCVGHVDVTTPPCGLVVYSASIDASGAPDPSAGASQASLGGVPCQIYRISAGGLVWRLPNHN